MTNIVFRRVSKILCVLMLVGLARGVVRADILTAGNLLYVGDSLTSSCCSLEWFGPVGAFGTTTYALAWIGTSQNWSSLFDHPDFAGYGPGTHYPQSGVLNSSSCANMQSDGNFVAYDNCSTARWATNTWGNPGAFLNAQNDGNLVVYSSSNTVLWALY